MLQVQKKVIVAIDPGVYALGVAVLLGAELHWAGLVQGTRAKKGAAAAGAAWGLLEALSRIGVLRWDLGVVEWPSQDDKRAAGAREDVSDLTGVAGACAAMLHMHGELKTPMPGQWKGQVPKHIHHGRLFSALVYGARLPRPPAGYAPLGPGMLTEAELGRIRWDNVRSENADIADAILLGKWAA